MGFATRVANDASKPMHPHSREANPVRTARGPLGEVDQPSFRAARHCIFIVFAIAARHGGGSHWSPSAYFDLSRGRRKDRGKKREKDRDGRQASGGNAENDKSFRSFRSFRDSANSRRRGAPLYFACFFRPPSPRHYTSMAFAMAGGSRRVHACISICRAAGEKMPDRNERQKRMIAKYLSALEKTATLSHLSDLSTIRQLRAAAERPCIRRRVSA